MFKRLLEGRFPKKSFFFFGPRQTGKSTLLSKVPSLLTVDLLSPKQQLLFNRDPDHLMDLVQGFKSKEGTVILDEVQKVPALLDVSHQILEAYPKLRLILCGSSARKLKKGAANLLGGRAAYRSLHPLTEEELGECFQWDRVLTFGSLPSVYSLLMEGDRDSASDLLEGYVVSYLREEIKAEALVRNLQGFQNFLDVAASCFSQQVNLLDVSRQCRIGYATVREYYAILEDTLIGFFLYSYLKSPRERMSHQPRFYFFDNGVTRALLGTVTGPVSPLEKGRLFEQWCVQELVRYNDYYKKGWKLFFWRTGDGAEVDLLIEEHGTLKCAVEFKSNDRISRRDLSGLRSFHEAHPKVPIRIIVPTDRTFKIDEFVVTSMKTFLGDGLWTP